MAAALSQCSIPVPNETVEDPPVVPPTGFTSTGIGQVGDDDEPEQDDDDDDDEDSEPETLHNLVIYYNLSFCLFGIVWGLTTHVTDPKTVLFHALLTFNNHICLKQK